MSFPRYGNYKDSEHDWLGNIPAHWKLAKFRYYFDESGEKIDGEVEGVMLAVSGYRGIEIKQYEDENQRRSEENLIGYRIVRPGQLVVNTMWLNYAGLGVSAFEGHVSPAYRAYCIDGSLEKRFVQHLLRSQQYVLGYTKCLTGVRPNSLQMSRDDLMVFPVLVPPVGEQRSIAKFLNQETAKIDALIEEQRRLIELLKEKRQAVISHAVTKGLNPDITMTVSGIDWLSDIPTHWSGIPLGYLIRFNSGGTPNKANEAYWDGDIPWVSPKDMKVVEISDAEDHVTELALTETGLRLIEPDHILVVVRGMILLHSFPAARNLVSVTINQDMKALKCCHKLLPGFLLYLFMGITKLLVSFAGESAHGTKKMETSVISGLQIPLPPLDEQLAITAWLDDKVAEYDSLLEKSIDAIELLGQRRAALISAAVTG